MRGRLQRSAAAATISAVAVLSGASVAAAPASAAPPAGTLLSAPAGQGIDNSYIVAFKEDTVARSAVPATARRLTDRQRGRLGHVYSSALQGFQATMDEAAARRLAADPAVAYVQQNTVMHFQDTQVHPPNNGLDRLDEPSWPLDGLYTYPTTAHGIRVYVIDSGIRGTHLEFVGRVEPGYDVLTGGPGTDDCLGHGTHVSGIVGGTLSGVAKSVSITPVRLTHCDTTLDAGRVIAAIDWITAHHQPGQRAVANMSLTGPNNAAVNAAVTRSINDGIVYTAAAGNNNWDACAYSPGNVPSVVTVAGTDFNGSDMVWPWSNAGSCVDMYAPGRRINSAWHTSDTDGASLDGTSMSAAFAAGVAAIIWSLRPSETPQNVAQLVSQHALYDMTLTTINPNPYLAFSPRRHLFVPTIATNPLPIIEGELPRVAHQMNAAGGAPPYRWSATGLPSTVTLNPTTGALSGIIFPGAYVVAVTATDANGRTGTVTEVWRSRSVCISC